MLHFAGLRNPRGFPCLAHSQTKGGTLSQVLRCMWPKPEEYACCILQVFEILEDYKVSRIHQLKGVPYPKSGGACDPNPMNISASSTNKRNQNPQPSGVGSKPSGSQTLKPGFWRLQKPQILNPQFSALRFRSLGFPGQSVKQSVAAELRCAMCELQECMFFGCFVSPLFFLFFSPLGVGMTFRV